MNLGIFKLRGIWLDGKTRKRNPLCEQKQGDSKTLNKSIKL